MTVPAQPQISVVIPAHNEADWLPAALAAVTRQVGPPPFELIVVNNASTDATAAVAGSTGARVINEPRPGVAHARQAGFLASAGAIIATTDADSQVPPDWLARIGTYFADHPKTIALGGSVSYDFADRRVRDLVNRLIPILHELDRRLHRGQPHFVGANFAVRRAAFESVGGFRTDLKRAEDLDLAHRLQKLGSVAFLPELVVTTSDRRFRREGPQALISYFQSYLEVTRPTEAVRRRIEETIDEIRNRWTKN